MKNSLVKKKSLPQKPNNKGMFAWILIVFVLAYIVQWDVSLSSGVILGVGMIGVLVLFMKSCKSPLPAMLVLACYIPFSKVLVGDFGGFAKAFNFTNVLMGFVLLGMFAQFVGKGKSLFGKNALNMPIFIFCAMAGVSFVKSAFYFGNYFNVIEFLSQIKRWVTPPLIFYLTYNSLRDANSLKKLVRIIMLVVVLVGCMAAWDYINLGDVASLEKTRIGGIADQPNQLAAFFVYYMFLYAGFFLVRFPRLSAWFALIPFAIIFRGIMVTFSRGGYVAFALGGLAISFFRSKVLFIVAVLALGFMISNPQFLPGGVRYRMRQTIVERDVAVGGNSDNLEDSLEASSGTRIVIWKAGMEMIKDKPMLGFGYGTFSTVVGNYDFRVVGRDAHNAYIIMAAEMGIPAVLVFLWIVGIVMMEARWLYKYAKDPFFKATALGVLGGIFGLLMSNMFGSRLSSLEISGYFWILAGIILRAKKIEMDARRKRVNPLIFPQSLVQL